MQLFKETNFDFLGKKWPFILGSLVLTVAGLASMALKGGIKYGIDFTGGAQMSVRFAGPPPQGRIRSALGVRFHDLSVQQLSGAGAENEVIIGTGLADEKDLEKVRGEMIQILSSTFGQPQ